MVRGTHNIIKLYNIKHNGGHMCIYVFVLVCKKGTISAIFYYVLLFFLEVHVLLFSSIILLGFVFITYILHIYDLRFQSDFFWFYLPTRYIRHRLNKKKAVHFSIMCTQCIYAYILSTVFVSKSMLYNWTVAQYVRTLYWWLGRIYIMFFK